MENSNPVLIEARGLSRRYGPNVAVEGVNLTLKRGEILGLLGPNGAGKSTTMKMLTGNLAPSTGSVRINGVDLARDAKAAKRHIGYLPEQPPVHPECTVDEYLSFAARLHGISGKAVQPAVERAKAACNLQAMSKRLIGNLSKGFQQRVGLAQAIIHRPPVIILDEPTVGLDPIQIVEIRNLIKSLATEHSVILSSHTAAGPQRCVARGWVLNQGRVWFDQSLQAMADGLGPRLRLQLARPPAQLRLEGVSSVQALGDGVFEVETARGTDLREQIAKVAVANDWGLLELRPISLSLEETFSRLTTRESFDQQGKAA